MRYPPAKDQSGVINGPTAPKFDFRSSAETELKSDIEPCPSRAITGSGSASSVTMGGRCLLERISGLYGCAVDQGLDFGKRARVWRSTGHRPCCARIQANGAGRLAVFKSLRLDTGELHHLGPFLGSAATKLRNPKR